MNGVLNFALNREKCPPNTSKDSHEKGVKPARIHFGPGYRVYFTRRGMFVYVLLIGGGKSTQKRGINRALKMAWGLEE